jgi:hypothetical protein
MMFDFQYPLVGDINETNTVFCFERENGISTQQLSFGKSRLAIWTAPFEHTLVNQMLMLATIVSKNP